MGLFKPIIDLPQQPEFTIVAIEFATSWKPLMTSKINVSDMIMIRSAIILEFKLFARP